MKFTAFFLLFAMLMMSLFNIDMVDARPNPLPVPAPVPIPKAYAKARPLFFLGPHIAGAIAAARIAAMRKQ
ncbi:hypothetical protein GQ42DRAFT_161223 [Ramicandelaber brevisporus]|nr:hypothetical protein GQ42DRAFT_161223 [Ramicandelaber brevisporus]